MPMASKKIIHPSGMSVERIDYMGSDLSVVNGARVSYDKESWWEDVEKLLLKKGDAGLINYLMKNRHGTPFEMVQFSFRVHVPIGVAREWMRHRIGSFNEVSTRYVQMEREYYTPLAKDWRRQVGKAGHYTYEPITDGTEHHISVLYELAMEHAFNKYDELLAMGLAKELARNVLPLGTFTSFIWSVNLRSLFNFMSLRTAPDALYEIQVPANYVVDLAHLVVPRTMEIWESQDRPTP